MKTAVITTFKSVFEDRVFFFSLVALCIFGIAVAIYIGIQLHPSELQVVTHYSAFGPTKFYRDKWYYLISFPAISILTAGLYSALACKLYSLKGRGVALSFVCLGAVALVFIIGVSYQVLKVASLS